MALARRRAPVLPVPAPGPADGAAGAGLYRLGLYLRAFVALSAVPSATVAGADGDGLTEALLLAAAVSLGEAVVVFLRGPGALGVRSLLAVDLCAFALLQAVAGASFPVVYFAAGTAALVGLLRGYGGLTVTAALAVAVCALIDASAAPSGPLLAVVPPLFLAAGTAGAAARSALNRSERTSRELAAERVRRAAVEERSRLARELHDTLLASLQGLHLSAQALLDVLGRDPAGGPGPSEPDRRRALPLAGQIADSLLVAGSQARELLHGLRTDGTTGHRLDEAVADAVRRWAAGVPVRAVCRLDRWPADDRPADPELRHEILRVVSEALANVERHARARTVVVTLAAGAEGRLLLTVQDDGVGFDPRAPGTAGHFGLLGMAERAGRLGGRLRVRSVPGAGTAIVLRVDAPAADRVGAA